MQAGRIAGGRLVVVAALAGTLALGVGMAQGQVGRASGGQQGGARVVAPNNKNVGMASRSAAPDNVMVQV
jgi:hypothetical protein